MSIAQLEIIDETITDRKAKLAAIIDLIEDRRLARVKLEAAVAAEQAELDALKPNMETLLAQEAVGDPVAGELEDARDAIKAATKRLATARKHDPEAVELALAENGLARRLAPLHDELTALFNKREQVRVAHIKAVAAAKMEGYASSAAQLADLFAEILALNDEIMGIIKSDPGIMAPQSMRICLPGFIGQPEHLLTQGGFPAVKAAAATRVRAKLEEDGVM